MRCRPGRGRAPSGYAHAEAARLAPSPRTSLLLVCVYMMCFCCSMLFVYSPRTSRAVNHTSTHGTRNTCTHPKWCFLVYHLLGLFMLFVCLLRMLIDSLCVRYFMFFVCRVPREKSSEGWGASPAAPRRAFVATPRAGLCLPGLAGEGR